MQSVSQFERSLGGGLDPASSWQRSWQLRDGTPVKTRRADAHLSTLNTINHHSSLQATVTQPLPEQQSLEFKRLRLANATKRNHRSL